MTSTGKKSAKKARKKTSANANSKSTASASDLIDSYIAELADWRGKTLAKIRNAFLKADPEIVEEWKWMGSPVWSRSGIIAVANAHKGKVKVTFNQGAHLPDPHNLFNNGLGGSQWRAIDLFEGDAINDSHFQGLIHAAVVYNLSKSK